MKKKVFISHSSQDKDFVDELANNLMSNSISVWYDKWEIKVGDSLINKINDGINECSFMIVVLSENSISSDWVQIELNAGLMMNLEKKSVKILPLLLHNVKDKIPPLFKDKKYAVFTEDYNFGFNEILESILGKTKDNVKFISKRHFLNYLDVFKELPEYTKYSLKNFVDSLVRDNDGRFSDTGYIILKYHIKGMYNTELETQSIYSGYESLILYGLVTQALISWDLSSNPKGIYFAGKLTKLGFLIANELGCENIHEMDFNDLADK